MMRRIAQTVEIQEPPLSEMKKKHSCMKRGCASSCGCLVFLIFGLFLFLHVLTNPRTRELSRLPETFPEAVPLYDSKDIEKITVFPGKRQGFIGSITRVLFGKIDSVAGGEQAPVWWRWISGPIKDDRDMLKVEWGDLGAEPDFIADFYKGGLTPTYTVRTDLETLERKQISFSGTNTNGIVLIEDDPSVRGTTHLSITIRLP